MSIAVGHHDNAPFFNEGVLGRCDDVRLDPLIVRSGVGDLLFEGAKVGDALLAEDADDPPPGDGFAFLTGELGEGPRSLGYI